MVALGVLILAVWLVESDDMGASQWAAVVVLIALLAAAVLMSFAERR